MKQVLFVFLSLFIACEITAQEVYDNFLKDGKTWLMRYKLVVNPDEYGSVYRFQEITLKEDSVIDGIPFKRICKRTYIPEDPNEKEEWTSTSSWLGQDESKIYLCERLWGETFECYQIMDFARDVGDILTLGSSSDGENSGVDFMVTNVSDTILESSTDKRPRRCLHLQSRVNSDEKDVWVEGIGSLYYGITGIVMGSHSGSIPRLMKCNEDEVILFQYNENETSVRSVVSNKVRRKEICHDLQGRKLKTRSKKDGDAFPLGIYIQNGKKFVMK